MMHNADMLGGYVHFLTGADDPGSQFAQMKAAGCEKVVREQITSLTRERLNFGQPIVLLAYSQIGNPTFDHSPLNTTSLVTVASDMQRAGAGLRSFAGQLFDPASELLAHVPAISDATKVEQCPMSARSTSGQAQPEEVMFRPSPDISHYVGASGL